MAVAAAAAWRALVFGADQGDTQRGSLRSPASEGMLQVNRETRGSLTDEVVVWAGVWRGGAVAQMGHPLHTLVPPLEGHMLRWGDECY